MNGKNNDLRRRATKRLVETEKSLYETPPEELSSLIHELLIHQVELEMQNEELLQKQIELEDSHKSYQDLWEFSPIGYVLLDENGRVTAINKVGAFLFNKPVHALLGKRFSTLVTSEYQPLVHLTVERALRTSTSDELLVRIRRPEGDIRFCQVQLKALGDHRDLEKIQVCITDVTEVKRMELRAKELYKEKVEAFALLDALFEAAPVGIGFWDLDYRFVRLNKALADINGLPVEDHLGKTLDDIVPDISMKNEIKRNWQRILDSGEPILNVEVTGETPACPGETRTWLENWYPVQIDGKTIGISATVTDVTERKRLEMELKKNREELETRVQEQTLELKEEIVRRKKFETELRNKGEEILREYGRRVSLSKKLVELLERERQEIARALHDEVGQSLTTLHIKLDGIKKELGGDLPFIEKKIENAQIKIRESVDYTRKMSQNLRPDILEHLGLAPSIRYLLDTLKEMSNIESHFFCKDIPKELSTKKQLVVYRIVQESLTNILRHARAKTVFINLINRSNLLSCTIEDDGIGFEYKDSSEKRSDLGHLGLVIMNERAVQVGGEMHIESTPGKGTQIFLEIPID